MKILETEYSLDSFFEELTNSASPLLMLDYDGTLAPFRVVRSAAVPYDGIRTILNKIIQETRTRLVLVSGRECNELNQLIGLDHPIEIWGSHGGERLYTDGRYESVGVNENQRRGLKLIDKWTDENSLDHITEQKEIARAFHFRGIDATTEARARNEIETDWRNRLQQYELTLHSFDGGLEIRPVGISKAKAVSAIRTEVGQAEVAAYLGDDATDEDAFSSLSRKDLPVLVRNEFRPTTARLWLRPPDELIQFLERWKSCSHRE